MRMKWKFYKFFQKYGKLNKLLNNVLYNGGIKCYLCLKKKKERKRKENKI